VRAMAVSLAQLRKAEPVFARGSGRLVLESKVCRLYRAAGCVVKEIACSVAGTPERPDGRGRRTAGRWAGHRTRPPAEIALTSTDALPYIVPSPQQVTRQRAIRDRNALFALTRGRKGATWT
jgi:hypothetical protein